MERPARAPLVGRTTTLSALHRSLDALLSGQSRVLAVTGEAGAGKSRLLTELAALADSAGLPVFSADLSHPSNEWRSDVFPAVVLLDGVTGSGWWESLLSRAPAGPLLVAISYRDGCAAVPPVLARTPWHVTRLPLQPLTADDVAALLPNKPDHVRRELLHASAGNPLYLTALSGVTDLGSPLPPDVLSVATGEVMSLDETSREVVFAVASAGLPADLELVVHITGLPEAAVLRALDALVVAGLVTMSDNKVTFRHPLVHTATYESAGVARRVHAHRRAAKYLHERGGPLPLLAYHLFPTATYGDTEAANTLVEAAKSVLDSSPTTAASWLDRATQILPHDPSLSPLLGYALSLSGNLHRSREVLHRDLTDDRSVVACARVERLLGHYAEADALLTRVPSSPDRALIALLRGDPAACVTLATDPVLLALGQLHASGTCDPRPAATVVDGLADPAAIDHLPWLAWAELDTGHLTDAARHIRRGLDFAHSTTRRSALPELLTVAAALATTRGNLNEARAHCREARALAQSMGSDELVGLANAVELPAILWQEGPDAVVAPAVQSSWWAELANLTLATTHLAAGNYATCLAHITTTAGSDLAKVSPLHRPTWAGHLAIALTRLGKPDEAHHWLASADPLARSQVFADTARTEATTPRTETPLHQAMARELLADHLATEGNLAAARTELGKAKEGYQSCGATWLSTRVRLTETRLGARAPRPRRPHGTVEALSGRELEVAELVAAGLTNREVATRLFLSSKTVEGHLARVFTKLGVKSRIGVAQRLAARST
ncbi:ATP-binding protein [Actinokineospora inagensis]|uniref:ATP-binding protein n=1 Tax=Actinokineospora inagensis TaxID=103730 RepID=UPI00041F8FB7|nr:LuxR family transcriptional regulator [Actinokineospora inagensis]